jgi:hypothetical protein
MAKISRSNINPDDYLDPELGYDMPVNTKAEPAAERKAKQKEKTAESCNPDDYLEAELGYEFETGEEACE